MKQANTTWMNKKGAAALPPQAGVGDPGALIIITVTINMIITITITSIITIIIRICYLRIIFIITIYITCSYIYYYHLHYLYYYYHYSYMLFTNCYNQHYWLLDSRQQVLELVDREGREIGRIRSFYSRVCSKVCYIIVIV